MMRQNRRQGKMDTSPGRWRDRDGREAARGRFADGGCDPVAPARFVGGAHWLRATAGDARGRGTGGRSSGDRDSSERRYRTSLGSHGTASSAKRSLRLLAAAAELTPEELTHDFQTAGRSILGTLAHLFAANRLWLARLTGAPPAGFVTDADRDLAALQRGWPELLERWQEWAAGLTDEHACEQIAYSDMKGNPWK